MTKHEPGVGRECGRHEELRNELGSSTFCVIFGRTREDRKIFFLSGGATECASQDFDDKLYGRNSKLLKIIQILHQTLWVISGTFIVKVAIIFVKTYGWPQIEHFNCFKFPRTVELL